VYLAMGDLPAAGRALMLTVYIVVLLVKLL